MPKIKDRFIAAARAFRSTTAPITEYIKELNTLSLAGINVNTSTAEKFSAVFACVRVYEWVVGTLPIDIKAQNKTGDPEINVDYLRNIIARPSYYHNKISFWTLMVSSLMLRGNALAIIERDKYGVPVKMIPISWSSVSIKIVDNSPIYVINDQDSGIKGNYLNWEVLHFRINNRDPWIGRSPITAARESIGLGLAAERFGASFFQKGGNIKAVLETENEMSSTSLKNIKDQFDSFYSGTSGDHKTPILESGLKYKPLGVAPNDAQFLETRVYQIQDIARFYGVPPSVIGENSRNTFSNGEQQNLQFLTYSVAPLCTMLENELEAKLLSVYDMDKIDIKFNLIALTRGDMAARATFAQTMVSSGIYTRNEIRKIENLPPIAGLDEPLNPAFLTGKTEEKPKEEKPKNEDDGQENN